MSLELELKEMRRMLVRAGFKAGDADALRAEGMGMYELEDRLRHTPGHAGSLEYTHGFKRSPTPYKAYVAKHGLAGHAIPSRGFCISDRVSGMYNACFFKKAHARRAAQLLADESYRDVDIVQVQNHGNDRFIAGQVQPKGRR